MPDREWRRTAQRGRAAGRTWHAGAALRAALGAVLAAGSATAADAVPRLELTLAGAESAALAASPELRAAEAQARAASDTASAVSSLWLPRFTLDASWRWAAEIPEVRLNPAAPPLAFGTHDSWSVGPAASWTLWDFGATSGTRHAAAASAAAARESAAATRAAIRLRARSVYLQTLLAAEQAGLLSESLAVAQQQARDIALRRRAGASSRADELASANDELLRRAQYRAAREDLAGSLRELLALTGLGAGLDPSLAAAEGLGATALTDAAPVTLRLHLDEPAALLERLAPAVRAGEDVPPARVRALADAARAARDRADAAGAARWPSIRLTARTGLDYPNGPVAETVHQTAVGVAASWPLFSFGQISRQARSARADADAGTDRAEQALRDAELDRARTRDAIASLGDQRVLLERAAAQARELADLMFVNYRQGGAGYLEVQSANLSALTTGVQAARTTVRLLVELSVAASLTE